MFMRPMMPQPAIGGHKLDLNRPNTRDLSPALPTSEQRPNVGQEARRCPCCAQPTDLMQQLDQAWRQDCPEAASRCTGSEQLWQRSPPPALLPGCMSIRSEPFCTLAARSCAPPAHPPSCRSASRRCPAACARAALLVNTSRRLGRPATNSTLRHGGGAERSHSAFIDSSNAVPPSSISCAEAGRFTALPLVAHHACAYLTAAVPAGAAAAAGRGGR